MHRFIFFVAISFMISAANAQKIVLIQLFTSEGCSSCPPADDLLDKLAIDGVTIIPMALHVDYWDRLGWRDPFSSQQFSAYQIAYQNALKNENIYTPQLVVDGAVDVVGSDRAAALAAIKSAAEKNKVNVSIQLQGDSVTVDVKSLPENQKCDVMLAITEDDLSSDVRRGENAGKKLRHMSVVRSLKSIGEISASASNQTKLVLDKNWNRDKLHIIAFVQATESLHVLGAASIRVTPND